MSQNEQIKDLKKLLQDSGLLKDGKVSKERIAEVKKKREAEMDLEGIDSKNIIEGSRRARRARAAVSYVVQTKIEGLSDDEEEPEEEEEEEEESPEEDDD